VLDLVPLARSRRKVRAPLSAFLVRRKLLLQIQELTKRLEENQRQLLQVHRLERERLSQHLHRGPLQEVVLLRTTLQPGSAEAAIAMQIEGLLRDILTETATTLLRDFGLPAALSAYASHLATHGHQHGCALKVEVDDAAAQLANDESFALYQLAHEALDNAVHHSGGRSVKLCLRVDGETVLLEVSDDGYGMHEGWKQARVDHCGLRDALALVNIVSGASTTVLSDAPTGVLIQARVPMRRNEQRVDEERAMAETGKIRILIAEDHVVVREGLRCLLVEDSRLVVVAEARTGHEILSLVLEHHPDILLLDLDLPGQSGLAALRAVQAHVAAPPRTIILSAYGSEEYVRLARELGVKGFLSKGCEEMQLRQTIFQVMAGVPVFDLTISAIARKQCYSAKGRFLRYADGSLTLTPAELAVLEGMLEGQTYNQIAKGLGRKHGTVRIQAAKVCEKLNVTNRGEAVRKALQLGILQINGTDVDPGVAGHANLALRHS